MSYRINVAGIEILAVIRVTASLVKLGYHFKEIRSQGALIARAHFDRSVRAVLWTPAVISLYL